MKSIRRTCGVVLCLALVVAAGVGLARQRATQQLTVYASVDTDWIAQIAQQFEKETGTKVAWIRESSGVLLQRLKAEQTHPKADVWFGGTLDAHAEAARTGLLEAFSPHAEPQLTPLFRNPLGNGQSTGMYGGVLGFGVNTPLLKKLGKPIPRSWDDLLNPAYKGLIAMANPNTSGTAFTVLATLVKLKGEQAAFDYLKRLHANITQYTSSGSAPGLLAGKGEIAIAILFLQDSTKQRVQGYPLTDVIPADGTGYEIGGLSLIKGGPNTAAGKRFMEWALEPRVQQIAARAGSYQVPSNSLTPLDTNVIPFSKAQLADLNVQWVIAARDHLLKRWNNEVFVATR